MKRIIFKGLGVLVLLIVVVVVAGMLGIDFLAKAGLVKGSGYALGVETSVDSVDLSLLSGTLAINRFHADNPEGYSSEHLLDSGRFAVELEPASVLSDTIRLRNFELDGLDINIEQKGLGSNVGQVLQNIEKIAGEPSDDKPSEKKVHLDRAVIRNVVAHFHLPVGDPVTVNIPEIVLNDVAADEAGGVAISQLVGRLLSEILAGVVEASEGDVPAGFLGDLDGQVRGATEALSEGTAELLEQIETDLLDTLVPDDEQE